MTGKVIDNAQDFVKFASEKCPNINVIFISVTDIENNREELDDRWDGILLLPNTQTTHCVTPVSKYSVKYSTISNMTEKRSFCFLQNGDHRLRVNKLVTQTSRPKTKRKSRTSKVTFEAGDFVLVQYNSKKSKNQFVGQIKTVKENEAEVIFLRKRDTEGHVFTFPAMSEPCWLNVDQIETKLGQPTIKRNRYIFDSSSDLVDGSIDKLSTNTNFYVLNCNI